MQECDSPSSKSLLEGVVKVLCPPQEQQLGLGLLGPNRLISAGWLEQEPWDGLWNVLWWALALTRGSEHDLSHPRHPEAKAG